MASDAAAVDARFGKEQGYEIKTGDVTMNITRLFLYLDRLLPACHSHHLRGG